MSRWGSREKIDFTSLLAASHLFFFSHQYFTPAPISRFLLLAQMLQWFSLGPANQLFMWYCYEMVGLVDLDKSATVTWACSSVSCFIFSVGNLRGEVRCSENVGQLLYLLGEAFAVREEWWQIAWLCTANGVWALWWESHYVSWRKWSSVVYKHRCSNPKRQTFSSPPTLHVICHSYLILTLLFHLLSRCSVDLAGDRSAGSPLLLSLESASWGADSCVPLPQSESLFGQNLPAATGVSSRSLPVLLGSAQLISWLRRAQQLYKIHITFWSLPALRTLPRHHGAVTTATRWTVSCQHTFYSI